MFITFMLFGCSTNTSQVTDYTELQSEISSRLSETESTKPVSTIPFIEDGNVQYISSTTSREAYYNTFEELEKVAGFIITGECISAEPIFQNDTLYTLSKIKISQVYKGNLIAGDTILVTENGGRTTYGEYVKGCAIEEKAFEQISERLPDDYSIVEGLDGYYTLKTGEQVLLFVGDVSGFLKTVEGPLYGIHGDTDGKLFLQDNGAYARPIPSETDTHIFGKDSLVISVNQLDKIIN